MSDTQERDDMLPDPHYGIVTGSHYPDAHPAANAPWNPAPETRAILDKVLDISAEYRIALTVRQVFYRLVARHRFPKHEKAYKRLKEYILSARRAGLIDWEAIRDDGDIVPSLPGWGGPEEFWRYVRALAIAYERRPEGRVYVEVWVEADGMVPQLETVADPFGVRVIGGKHPKWRCDPCNQEKTGR
jgi:hypothetical protein